MSMLDLNPDRWLEREADEYEERMTRENDVYIRMLQSDAYRRIQQGLPPVEGMEYDDEGELHDPREGAR